MGLFDVFKRNQSGNFNEYIAQLSCDEKKLLLDSFSVYGNPEEILEQVLNTASCYLDNRIDVRINDTFLLQFYKKKHSNYPQVYIYKLDRFSYCYHSRAGSCCSYDVVGLMRKNGDYTEIMVKKSKLDQSVAIFRKIQQHLNGFEQITAKPVSPKPELVSRLESLFSDPQNLIWCEQFHDSDGDSYDPQWLKLYSLNKRPATLHYDSEKDAFIGALQLKQIVPHLLYGPSEEYENLYKTDRQQLMSLAKSKMNSQQFSE